MSLRTKIRSFTAWVNMRLLQYDQLLNNCLMDLLTGTHMKFLIESMTGSSIKRLESFDGLSQQQKQTRIDWIVDELKSNGVLPQDSSVDSRLFVMRSADQVFEVMWRLVSHDIWFVWERAEYLQHEDEDILCQVPFKWTPEPIPEKPKAKKSKKSLLTGFGPGAVIEEQSESQDEIEIVETEPFSRFPNADYVKKFKKKKVKYDDYPSPEECIMEMVNYQLKTTRDGRSLYAYKVDDLVDSRVLCALVNSFVPNTFTSDLLLNDRWTINLALKAAERMLHADTPFNSEDLVESDPQSVCAYFCFFFMMGYKFRQSQAVLSRYDFMNRLIRECNHQLDKMPAMISNMQELQRRKDLKQEIEQHKLAQEKLKKRFDIKYCQKWMQHVEDVKSEVRKQIRDKMKDRFDVIDVPRNISVNDYCLSCVVNLTLTNGSGFYLAMQRESLPEGRKVVLRNKRTKEFHDDFSGKRGKNIYREKQDDKKSGPSVRELLKLPSVGLVDVHPNDHPDYEIYVEASSRNKQLKAGQQFLYQVFHGNTVSWQRLFIKAARDNEYETVEKMIVFFQSHPAFINSKEPKSANTALHWACRNGHFDVVRLLLENGANIDAKNIMKNTPLNAAIEGLHRKVCHLLIEWGCDVHCKNTKQLSPFETVKNDDFKKYLIELYEHYSNIVPKIMSGDMDLLDRSLSDHSRGYKEYCCLRSRCINGSTLLHTTAYHGHIQGIRDILSLRVDVNVRDYKGATALHRSRNASILEEILDSGALVDAEDSEGNTPLHVKCYGETGKPAEMASIELLLHKNANICKRNNRSLLPIHCCAMQGRIDVMKMLIRNDQEGLMIKTINAEEEQNPPSLPHLAVANDFIDSAKWLIENGFYFKEKEQNILLRRILTEQLNLKSSVDAVQFLLDNDAEVNPRYPGGNCALHYSAGLDGSSEILELFLSYGADVDPINEEGRTPLFYATQANNQFAACVLLEQGANVRQKDVHGLTAFDYIVDYDEWIECGYFTDDIKARLKAFSLKHARDLVRAISKKVKTNPFHPLRQRMLTESTMGLTTPGSAMNSPVQTKPLSSGSAISAYSQLSQILPPINRRQSVGMGYLHHTGNVGIV
ncbi:uncharacterized protein LOC127705978 isoform X4 [Mytilus californianus]|uniref:uncharacterized protein LOC127705978 isoform X4 n=1 Tax=Mytilus californianus TaxID=6549 RepID=UPI0022480809|nr:uncharacterized protein LOC127705978 isoform X4 [Mytilus californianus]